MPSPSARRPGNEPKPASRPGLGDRLFAGLAGVATRWPLGIIALFVALTAAAYLYIRDFPIRTAYLDLLPQDDPLVIRFRAVEQDVAAADVIAVLLTLASPPPDAEERERILVAAAGRVIEALDLARSPDLVSASYRVGEGIVVPPELLIFRALSPAELDRLREIAREVQADFPALPAIRPLEGAVRLAPPAITDAATARTALAELAETGRAGHALLESILARQDLLAEAAAIARAVLTRPVPEVIGEPILSPDRSRLVVQIWPSRPAFESLSYNQAVTRAVRDAVARAELGELGVTAGITGTYVLTVETDELIRRDMNLVTLVSAIVVFALVLGVFASPLLGLAAVLPVLVAVPLTMAWAKYAVGGFNLLTMFLPALILGLGIEYSIHILSRYVEERAKGQKANAALVTAVRTKGAACLIAGGTTAAAFSVLLLSRSRALWEMGAITGVGILIALTTTFLLAPALIALTARNRPFRTRSVASATALQPMYRRFLRLRPGVVALGVILTGAILYQATRVEFRFVSDELVPVTPAQTVFNTVAREFAGDVWLGDSFRFFVEQPADIPSVERALARHPMVRATSSVRGMLPKELLGGEISILDLPVAEVHEGVTDLAEGLAQWDATLAALQNLIVDLAQLELLSLVRGQPDLAEALSRGIDDLILLLFELEGVDAAGKGVRLAAMSRDLEDLTHLVERVVGLPPEPVLLDQILALLPMELRARYFTRSGLYVVEARMAPAIREGRNLPQFLDWADGLPVERFGLLEVTAHLELHMRRDFLVSTVLALAVIFLLVMFNFPRPTEAALALAPLLMGYAWMLAGMNLLGIQFNFTNIIISPLLIGVGVDSAVLFLHRVKEERAAGGDAVVRSAAASIVPIAVSLLTTMAPFGALLAAHTPGLQLLGASALLGLGFTLLWSLTFLPAAAALRVEKGKPER